MAHKKFDPALFKRNDRRGREAVKAILFGVGYFLDDNPDPYGIDLVGFFKGKRVKVEVDRKESWRGERFPFGTVVVTSRKEKFMGEEGGYHAVVNNEGTTVLVAEMRDIRESKTKILKSKYMPDGEKVFDVPVGKFKVYRRK